MGFCKRTGAGNRSKHVNAGKCGGSICSNCGKCSNSECSGGCCTGCGSAKSSDNSGGCIPSGMIQWGIILIIAFFVWLSGGC